MDMIKELIEFYQYVYAIAEEIISGCTRFN